MNAKHLKSDLATADRRAGRGTTPKRGSGQRQAEKGAILRAQVLDAAIDCLSRLPYSEVTTTVIADRAGG